MPSLKPQDAYAAAMLSTAVCDQNQRGLGPHNQGPPPYEGLSQGKSPLQRQYPPHRPPHSGLQNCPTEPGAVMHLLDTGAQNFTSVVHRASPVYQQQQHASDLSSCGLPLLQSPHKTSVGSGKQHLQIQNQLHSHCKIRVLEARLNYTLSPF